MSFSTGFTWGYILGVGLMALMYFFSALRQKQRARRAAVVNLMSRLDQKNLPHILSGNPIPSWVTFTEYDKVRWLNTELQELWHYVDRAASFLIKETIEPEINQTLPSPISSIKFKKFTLGNDPPNVAGVRISKEKRDDQVYIDLDIKWAGSPNIVLQINSMALSVPVGVKDLKFYGIVRLIMEVTTEVPVVAAIVVSLLSVPKPVVEFKLKAIGGSLTAIPGLAATIEEVIYSALDDLIVWPKRIVVPIIPGYDCKHLELRPEGILRVTVLKATNLRNVDVGEMLGNLSDPFVTVWSRPKEKFTTKVIDNNLNPVWNEAFEVEVDDYETSQLFVKVQDEGQLIHTPLGYITLTVFDFKPDEEVTVTYNLHESIENSFVKTSDTSNGSITLKLRYKEYTEEEMDMAFEKKKQMETKKAREAEKKKEEPLGADISGILAFGAAASSDITSTTDATAPGCGSPRGIVTDVTSGVASVAKGGVSLFGSGFASIGKSVTDVASGASSGTKKMFGLHQG